MPRLRAPLPVDAIAEISHGQAGAISRPQRRQPRSAATGRDNEVLLDTGRRTLRFGWRSVTVTTCATAGQVLVLLRRGGWTGTPKRCGPTCTLPLDSPPPWVRF
jgi:hypothetical protein